MEMWALPGQKPRGFCPGQRAGAAMGHRSPLWQLLSYSSVVAAAQQKSESGFKSAQEEALAVQAYTLLKLLFLTFFGLRVPYKRHPSMDRHWNYAGFKLA